MEKARYVENARQIFNLADGMTSAQWSRINHLIVRILEQKEAKVTFEKPDNIDLLMKQDFIS